MANSSTQWPLVLTTERFTLRPLRLRDKAQWDRVRAENHEWLTPWEATLPRFHGEGATQRFPSFFAMVANHNREGKSGRSLSMAIWHENKIVGQITMGGIIYGALRGAHIGYWVDKRYANLGIITQAVKTMTEYAFTVLELHRIEINVRPENIASRRVAEKAGYVFEGERPRFLHIDGQWRDHLCFVKENTNIF